MLVIDFILIAISLYVIYKLEERTPAWICATALVIIILATLHFAITIQLMSEERQHNIEMYDNDET